MKSFLIIGMGNFGHYLFDNEKAFLLKAVLRRKRFLKLLRFGVLETIGQMWFDTMYIVKKLI